METLTAQEAQEHLQKILETISKDNKQIRVTSCDGNVVILPEEMYNNLLITLEVLSTPGLMNSLREANLPADFELDMLPLMQNEELSLNSSV